MIGNQVSIPEIAKDVAIELVYGKKEEPKPFCKHAQNAVVTEDKRYHYTARKVDVKVVSYTLPNALKEWDEQDGDVHMCLDCILESMDGMNELRQVFQKAVEDARG